MRTVVLNWNSKPHEVTALDIRNAFRRFDTEFRGKEIDAGTDYVIVWHKRRYPPKRILELATGISVRRFSGGEMTNSVFQKLGFKAYEDGSFKDTERHRLEATCPALPELLDKLFRQHWVRLNIRGKGIPLTDDKYPGVYVLAYTETDLSGRRVRERDVYYVGMSNVGVQKRLRQFRAGLLDGHHHSGAKRFFHQVNDGKPYDESKAKKKFFVASISIPCRCRKTERGIADLQKLGTVAALEFYVLGRIKQECGEEPWLNEK